jgi:hypothetical protein
MALTVDFCGEHHEVPENGWLTVGREGDVVVDDNPYLHRRFLQIGQTDGLWWVVNVGDQLAATVADSEAACRHGCPVPGSRSFEHDGSLPAGRISYELELHMAGLLEPIAMPGGRDHRGTDAVHFRPAVAGHRAGEPILRSEGECGVGRRRRAAQRLGWTSTKFNRKLDNVSEARESAFGVHGAPESSGLNLAWWSTIAVRLVTTDDLLLLSRPDSGDLDDRPDAARAVRSRGSAPHSAGVPDLPS